MIEDKELTLRDRFAISALPSVITYMDKKLSKLTYIELEGFDVEEACCDQAYKVADKMLKARQL